jgi:hypothetical protein
MVIISAIIARKYIECGCGPAYVRKREKGRGVSKKQMVVFGPCQTKQGEETIFELGPPLITNIFPFS